VRFFVLNLIGAIVWAVVFAYGGYFLGETFKMFMDDYHRYALYVLGGLVTIGLSIWLFTLSRLRRAAKRHGLK
jgi:membrane protein DedA with SNARE-associated domain